MNDVIRPASAADIPRLTILAQEAYAKYVARIGRRPAPMDPDFAAHVADGEVDVLIRDGVILAFVIWRLEADHGFIDNIAVDPAQAGRGLGKALLVWVEARTRLRGLHELRLYTNAKMTENLTLYPRWGWEMTDRRMQDGFDRVFFRKRLAP